MDDNKMTPELNFDSFDATAMPSLTLEVEQPKEEAKPAPAPAPDPLAEEAAKLSSEEQKMVEDFANKIDVTNSQMVLQYGAATQKKVGDFERSCSG